MAVIEKYDEDYFKAFKDMENKFEFHAPAYVNKSINLVDSSSENALFNASLLLEYSISKAIHELFEYRCHAGDLPPNSINVMLVKSLKKMVKLLQTRTIIDNVNVDISRITPQQGSDITVNHIKKIKEHGVDDYLVAFKEKHPDAVTTGVPKSEWLNILDKVKYKYTLFFARTPYTVGRPTKKITARDWNTYLDREKLTNDVDVTKLLPTLSSEEKMILEDNCTMINGREVNYDYGEKDWPDCWSPKKVG